MLWTPNLLAGAWSPFLALAGGLGALIGLAHKDRRAVWAGLFGAAVAVRHVVRVTAPHDGFARAFGSDWQSRIPPELRAHAAETLDAGGERPAESPVAAGRGLRNPP